MALLGRCAAFACRRAPGALTAAAPRLALGPRGSAVAVRARSVAGHQRLEDSLDPKNLLTQSRWTEEELDSVAETHREPRTYADWAAYYTVKALRFNFDLFSLYKLKNYFGGMRERDWIRRIIFLETIAGVPGVVAGMVRHLHSLRLMRRDHGWIHSLWSEAENERMHLLIALQLREPGVLFRAMVIVGQFVFLSFYTLAYLLCPRYGHRFVGYLEEEAIHTYSTLLDEIDSGRLPLFANMKAPAFARTYYNLDKDAMLREVFACIRADESAHRDTNHHFGDLKPDEPNTMVEHMRKGHFQHQNVFSGVASVIEREKERAMLDEFRKVDVGNTGYIAKDKLRVVVEQKADNVSEEEMKHIFKDLDPGGSGRVRYEDFVKRLHE